MEDGSLGDFVKHHPLVGYFRFEKFKQVPRDTLPLSVFISCKEEIGRLFELTFQLLDYLLFPLRDNIFWFITVFDIDREV